MVHTDKPSLSVCAFGAGAAHAAMLALVLPVMITLPAPEDRARGTVAIQVVVRSAPPPFIAAAMSHPGVIPEAAIAGEGDADETAWTAPADMEVTGALPDMPEQVPVREEGRLIEEAALVDSVIPAPPVDAAAPVDAAPVPQAEARPCRAAESRAGAGTATAHRRPRACAAQDRPPDAKVIQELLGRDKGRAHGGISVPGGTLTVDLRLTRRWSGGPGSG